MLSLPKLEVKEGAQGEGGGWGYLNWTPWGRRSWFLPGKV